MKKPLLYLLALLCVAFAALFQATQIRRSNSLELRSYSDIVEFNGRDCELVGIPYSGHSKNDRYFVTSFGRIDVTETWPDSIESHILIHPEKAIRIRAKVRYIELIRPKMARKDVAFALPKDEVTHYFYLTDVKLLKY